MSYLQILILAIVQGAAELLPVSSSAHVITAERLLGLDPTLPQMTLLLVMLHTGTMFAVIAYFWSTWRKTYFSSWNAFLSNAKLLLWATVLTGVVGLTLQHLIKRVFFGNAADFEIEQLFGNPRLMAAALAAAGVLIFVSSKLAENGNNQISLRIAALIGAVQGLCLPFRGFSRSGATISTGLVLGVGRQRAEEFSFALAVVLTPAVVAKEAYRLYHSQAHLAAGHSLAQWDMVLPYLVGMVLSFLAGLGALRWLSRWLEQGYWHLFGIYCLFASVAVLAIG